jgi:hypothetical protein
MLPPSQLLYGSDEPFNSTVAINESVEKINFASDEAIAMRVNAICLFPRLRAQSDP